MADAISDFFKELGGRHDPRLEKVRGTLRFDLMDGDGAAYWMVTVSKGDITVSRVKGDADCVVSTDRTLFDGVVRGEVNAMAAVLRGAAGIEGDPEMLVRFQRLFPGPPGSNGGGGATAVKGRKQP